MNESEISKIKSSLLKDTTLDSAGKSLLHVAAGCSSSLLKSLVKKKYFNLDQKDSLGNTPLMYAAKSGSHTRIQYLLSAGASLIVNNDGENALHYFCRGTNNVTLKCEEIIETFHSNKLTVYSRDRFGNTPAHIATLKEHRDILNYFVTVQHFSLDMQNE